jgi:hypothetical protein
LSRLIASLLSPPAIVGAQSIATMVTDFGLIGTWAARCDQLPSAANEHAVFSVTATGNVQLVNDFARSTTIWSIGSCRWSSWLRTESSCAKR